MKITVTVTREYEMDERRVLAEPDFRPPAEDAEPGEKQRWLIESFWELCGFGRYQDHLDGSYVRLIGEESDTDYNWPETLTTERESEDA